MFELEVSHKRLNSLELPPEIRERFTEQRHLTHLAPVKWEEHCTECGWPACYVSCDLYNPRNDGNCRRTVDGFSPLLDVPILGGYAVRVGFLRWCTLTATCSLPLVPSTEVQRQEVRLNKLSLLAARTPDVGRMFNRPGLASRTVRKIKRQAVTAAARRETDPSIRPDYFLIEVYNPTTTTVPLSVDLADAHPAPNYIPFKRLEQIGPGYSRIKIPYDEIGPHLVDAHGIFCAITPNILDAGQEGMVLYFGLLTFVKEAVVAADRPAMVADKPASSQPKVKIMVWDLDNTLWNGTLIEDGPGKVTLRPGVAEVVRELDGRGIVNSVASKNYEADALTELERLGLREFFVFPAIGWHPKSESLRQLRQSFNVGEDTIAFIDDQPFEREEVLARNPKVRVYSPDDLSDLTSRDEFKVAATDEARSRRKLYQNEEARKQAMSQASGEYSDFLRQSNIVVRVERPTEQSIHRIHELVQRTNQMNFSGNRYTKDDLLLALSDRAVDSYLIDAEDKFGKYGYIGFAMVRRGTVPRVVELTFSCRVQSKHVEHAVLLLFMRIYAAQGHRALEVFRRVTDKNEQVAQVFPALDFELASREANDCVHRRTIPYDGSFDDVVLVEMMHSDGDELLVT